MTSAELEASGDRIVALDFVRGIAVLGILAPNVVAYGYPMLAYYWPHALAGGATAADGWVWLVQLVLIDGKFRGLFTLLFGAGIALFLERARRRGGGEWLQVRRLFWLALFGLAHFYLLWTGDILLLYALSGLAALPLANISAQAQLRTGIVWFCAASLLIVFSLGSQVALEASPQMQAERPEAAALIRSTEEYLIADAAAETEVMAGKSYGQIVAWRVSHETENLPYDLLYVALLETIPLILIGMALYRMGLFDGRFDQRAMRRWALAGVIAGGVLTLGAGVWALRADFPFQLTQFVFHGFSAALALPMAVGLLALLVLWAPAAAQTWLGRRFVAAGRMAFSNYIGTSVLMMLVFQGWAGGFYGSLHRIDMIPPVLLTWFLMLLWSPVWLSRFRYGPLEWLWRCLTYGQWVAFRR